MQKGSCSGGVALHICTCTMYMLLQYVCTSLFFSSFVPTQIQSTHCGCLILLPAHQWQLKAQSFQGVAERLKGGAKVKQIERVIVEYLGFFCSRACAVNAPSPQPWCPHPTDVGWGHQGLPPTRHCTSPPLRLWVEPAQSCQCASLCQPNYRTHLKGGKSSSELPGGAFPLWV